MNRDDLDRAIIDLLDSEVGPNDPGLYDYEVVGCLAEWGAATPAEWRSVKSALARLVKYGEIIEDRELDANRLPIYRLVPTTP